MTKIEFIADLYDGLSGLPEAEAEERVAYFSEMIDDQIENGLNEEDAVAQMGPVDKLVNQILSEVPMSALLKTKKKRRLTGGEIALLILGAPLWFPLLVAVFSVMLSIYISWWALIISLCAVFAALAACGLGGVASGVLLITHGDLWDGIALIGAGLVCAGLAVFAFYGCKYATTGTLRLTKKIWLGCKKRLIRKEKGV